MHLSDLSDLVVERIALKAYNLKFTAVESDTHYMNRLAKAIRNEFLDLTKSKTETMLRNSLRFSVSANSDFDQNGFDLPASRKCAPSIQAQAKETLRLVMEALHAYARKSKAACQAARVFYAATVEQVSPRDIARMEHISQNLVHLTVHRLRKYLCKAVRNMER